MSNSMSQNLFDSIRMLQKIYNARKPPKVKPNFSGLNSLTTKLKNEEGLSGTAGDKANQALAAWKKKKAAYVKRLDEFEALSVQTLKSANDINSKSATALKQTGGIATEMAKLGKKLEDAQKKGDTATETKLAQAIAAQGKKLESKLGEVTGKISTAKIQYDLVKTTCSDYPFPN
ncbi:MAG: hypothetical protein AAFR79_07370 [Pseudomonadota bacterium]